MRLITLTAAMLVLATQAGSALAAFGDADAGKRKYVMCAACHGVNGVSSIPTYPNLAGQQEDYLVAQLKAFRDGARQSQIMSPMAKPLSNRDIENLAVYLSGLSCGN